MLSVLEIIKKTTDFFTTKGVENPRLNAEHLVGHALGLKRMQLYLQFERLLSEPELEKIRPLVRRRAQREPLQYIMGQVEWGDLTLKVDRRALIPRPETELLLEMIVNRVTKKISTDTGVPTPEAVPPQRILDLGTGTGALALGLARALPTAHVVAVDASDEALSLARENATATSLADRTVFLKSNWYDGLSPSEAKPFDIIVSNPPYLTAQELNESEPEVRQFEPPAALVATEEGCADLFHIIAGAAARLQSHGFLALETGIAQHAALCDACTKAGFKYAESHKDLTGRDRFIIASLN